MVRFDADVSGDSTLKDPPSIRPRMGHLPRWWAQRWDKKIGC
jgi:hypothetical protein